MTTLLESPHHINDIVSLLQKRNTTSHLHVRACTSHKVILSVNYSCCPFPRIMIHINKACFIFLVNINMMLSLFTWNDNL